MAKIQFAIVKAGSRIPKKIMDAVIERIIGSAGDDYSVFVAKKFRVRDKQNRRCTIDVETKVIGRGIDTVIFFSRPQAEFWEKQFPILRRVILITRKERTSPRNKRGAILLSVGDKIVVVNVNDVDDDFIKDYIV